MGFALALLGFVVRFHDNIGFGARTAAVLIEAIPGNIPTVLDVRAPPRVSTVTYTTRDGFELQADVYEPVGADGEAALILVNGVEPEGRKYLKTSTLLSADSKFLAIGSRLILIGSDL